MNNKSRRVWKDTALFYDAQYFRKSTVNSKQNTLGRYFSQGAPENDMFRCDNISTVARCLETIL